MSRAQKTHKYKVDLKEPNLLEQALIGMGKVDGEYAAKMLGLLGNKKTGLQHKKDRTEVRMEHRKKVLQEQRHRYKIKRAEMESAQQRMELSAGKFNELSMSVRALSHQISTVDSITAQSVGSINKVAAILSDEAAMRSRLTMLSFIEGSLDTSFPLRYELTERGDGSYDQCLYWVTKRNPVGWSCRASRRKYTSLSEFGPFVVCVRRTLSESGSAHVSTNVRMMGSEGYESKAVSEWNDFDDNDLSDYIISSGHAHPHISSGGEVCLGDSQAPLLRQMEGSDYAQVVQTIMLILTQYNSRDPYRALSGFELVPSVGAADEDTATTCGACFQLHLKCVCLRSSVGGAVMQEFEKSPCGCTITECVHNHERFNSTKGINGTGCFPLRSSPDYPVTAAGKEHPGTSAKIAVFEEAIKVLDNLESIRALTT